MTDKFPLSRSKLHIPSQADLEKRAERRARSEDKIRADRARPIAHALVNARHFGVVTLANADIEYFMEGLKAALPKTPIRSTEYERVHKISANGSIQGKNKGDGYEDEIRKDIVRHRRIYGGAGVIAFMGFKFEDTESTGTPGLLIRAIELLERFEPNDPSILLVGEGQPRHLPTQFDPRTETQHPVAQLVPGRWALNDKHELSPDFSLDGRFISPLATQRALGHSAIQRPAN